VKISRTRKRGPPPGGRLLIICAQDRVDDSCGISTGDYSPRPWTSIESSSKTQQRVAAETFYRDGVLLWCSDSRIANTAMQYANIQRSVGWSSLGTSLRASDQSRARPAVRHVVLCIYATECGRCERGAALRCVCVLRSIQTSCGWVSTQPTGLARLGLIVFYLAIALGLVPSALLFTSPIIANGCTEQSGIDIVVKGVSESRARK